MWVFTADNNVSTWSVIMFSSAPVTQQLHCQVLRFLAPKGQFPGWTQQKLSEPTHIFSSGGCDCGCFGRHWILKWEISKWRVGIVTGCFFMMLKFCCLNQARLRSAEGFYIWSLLQILACWMSPSSLRLQSGKNQEVLFFGTFVLFFQPGFPHCVLLTVS